MVVDDHRLLAEALASALKLRGHRVLAAAAPAAGAAELVITRAPEVCLIGTATPDEPGIFDPVVKIKKERPQVAVLVLGPVPNPRGIAAAFAAGASGYVRHDERIEGVERAIMKARAGEAAVAPQLLQGAFSELLNPANIFYGGKSVQLKNPTSGLPYAGNIIPASELSPNGLGILKAYPLPNLAVPINGNNNL